MSWLQDVNITIFEDGNCGQDYESYLTEDMICAGVKAGGKGVCHGDSGGPLVVR